MKNENLKEECSAFLSAVSEEIDAFLRKISGEWEQQKTLAEFQPGEIVAIADHEMIVLDQHKPDCWWWLATANATSRHANERWVVCLSPSGNFSRGGYGRDYGVRPFCILKSDISVSG